MDRKLQRPLSRHVGTLGEVLRHGGNLWLTCERCRHSSILSAGRLAEVHGLNCLLRRAVDRAICTSCHDPTAEVSCTHTSGQPGYSYGPPVSPSDRKPA